MWLGDKKSAISTIRDAYLKMTIYEAYLSPGTQQESAEGGLLHPDRLDHVRLLPDKKSVFALVFPALWLVWNRLWFELIVYMIFVTAIAVLGTTSFAQLAGIISIVPGLYLLLEGNRLIAAKMERAGWQLADVIDAENLESAEMRFFSKRGASANKPQISNKPLLPQPSKLPNDRPDFGLFSED